MPKFMPKGASILETILLISVIDLPYRSGNVKIESNQGLGMIITSPYQCLIYKDFFKKSEFNLTNTTIVRVNLESVARSQKKILQQGDPLWTDATYQCNIIITNLTAVEQDFQFMFQIPQGSIYVRNNKTVNYSSITLQPFQTRNVYSQQFYFPQEGVYEHAPIFVYLDNDVVALSEKSVYSVKLEGTVSLDPKKEEKKYQTRHKIATAKKKEILDIIRNDPILAKDSEFHFRDIYHMLKENAFYKEVIAALKRRKIYDRVSQEIIFDKGV